MRGILIWKIHNVSGVAITEVGDMQRVGTSGKGGLEDVPHSPPHTPPHNPWPCSRIFQVRLLPFQLILPFWVSASCGSGKELAGIVLQSPPSSQKQSLCRWLFLLCSQAPGAGLLGKAIKYNQIYKDENTGSHPHSTFSKCIWQIQNVSN